MFTAILLTGCKAPEMEFDTADEAKEALDTASVIEIYSDLDSSRRKTKILADGKVAGYLQGNTVYIDGEVLFDGDGNAVGTGDAGKEGVGILEKLYTNIYQTVFETDPQANMTVEFMGRMAMYKCLQEDIRWIYDEPVNTGVEIYGTVAVLLIIILSIVYVKRK